MAPFSDRDYQMEVDRMINEGLGGGVISNDLDESKLELYPQNTAIPENQPLLNDKT